jgi:hypothetical protein
MNYSQFRLPLRFENVIRQGYAPHPRGDANSEKPRMFRTSLVVPLALFASLQGSMQIVSAAPKTVAEVDPVSALSIMAQIVGPAAAADTTGAAVEGVADAKGNLHVPEDYRARYRFIGSWAVAADDKGSKEVHTVYASPGAVEGYLKSGHFEDGAILVKEVFGAKTTEMTTGTVSHADSLKGWFVMIRDAKNTAHPGNALWGDGWGWSWFDYGNTTKTTSSNYKTDCMGCHVPATPTDFIYVDGYPSLKR